MSNTGPNGNISASFRDTCGFLFRRDGKIFRQINFEYKEDYDHLIGSGLYDTLVRQGLLIPHEDADIEAPIPDKAYKIIRPEYIRFISYPYEWSFSQLKAAALTTLDVQKKALEFGMVLKDASAYNIQFRGYRPVLVDTLSFEKYEEGKPWLAYRQFCQHFLAPLALMGHTDIRLSQLLRVYIDGVPLDLASRILPFRTCFVFPLLVHIHLHAKGQRYFANRKTSTDTRKMSLMALAGLIDNLGSAVKSINWYPEGTEWSDYYEHTNYSRSTFEHKKKVVTVFLDKVRPQYVWDLGANIGVFSRIAAGKGIETVSFDIDPASVEKNYLECTKRHESNIVTLLFDLCNPSPGIGWQNCERMTVLERGPADMVFALALIHHLAISNNLPFDRIAGFLRQICRFLIIEFISKEDSQVQRLLSTRKDIFSGYTQQEFEKEFKKFFNFIDSVELVDSKRTVYLMEAV